MEQFSLKDKVVLITGAATGIGQAIAIGMAEAGANLGCVYHESDVSGTVSEIEKLERRTVKLKYDLSKPEVGGLNTLVAETAGKLGDVDILVNCAGVNLRNLAINYTEEDWDKVFNVNLKSAFFLSQAMAKYLIGRGKKGKIINIASLLSFQGGYNTAGYTSTKSGLAGLTKLLANELGQHGINVNGIAPGYIKTNMTQKFIDNTEVSDRFFQRIPLKRWGSSEDIKGTAVFLASSASDYVNGQIICVDGGYLNT